MVSIVWTVKKVWINLQILKQFCIPIYGSFVFEFSFDIFVFSYEIKVTIRWLENCVNILRNVELKLLDRNGTSFLPFFLFKQIRNHYFSTDFNIKSAIQAYDRPFLPFLVIKIWFLAFIFLKKLFDRIKNSWFQSFFQ